MLLDAFVPEPYKIYEPLGVAEWEDMRRVEPPFDRVVAAVVSHVHADHFQAEAAAAFMHAHPHTVLFGPPSIEKPLRQAGYSGDRYIAALPGYGESASHSVKHVRFKLLRLRHRAASEEDVENLGVIVELGGRRVLHVGDAYPDRPNFAPFDLPAEQLDFAVVPYWFFMTDYFSEGPELIEKLIAAACVLPSHVPLEGRDDVLAHFRKEGRELPISMRGVEASCSSRL